MSDEMAPMQDVRPGQTWRYSNEDGSMDVFVLGPSCQFAGDDDAWGAEVNDDVWDVEINHPSATPGASYLMVFIEGDRDNWELVGDVDV